MPALIGTIALIVTVASQYGRGLSIATMRAICLAVLIPAGMISSPHAWATNFTTFTDETAFTNSLPTYWSNDFSALGRGQYNTPPPLQFTGSTTGSFAYTASADGGLFNPSTGPSKLTTFFSDRDLVFAGFSSGISAFGGRFFVANANYADYPIVSGRSVTLSLLLSDSSTVTATRVVDSTSDFLGLSVQPSLSITRATLSRPGVSPNPEEEKWVMASGQIVVPEPATFAMASVAAGIAWVRWMRRRSHAGEARQLS